MNIDSQKYSGILLAGGKSSRMGKDKAFMKYGDRFLYEYSLSVLSFFSGDILLSSSNLNFNNAGYRIIPDEIIGIGPIGGIYSCLSKIKNESAIVLSCDLPLISTDLVSRLINNSGSFEITIALNHKNQPEPLIGIYSASIIPLLKRRIDAGQYKMLELFSEARTNFVSMTDFPPEVFSNLNKPDDFNSLPPAINA